MGNTGGVIAALLAGTIVGAGLGILFAPEKGEVTREKIRAKAKEKADEFEVSFDKNVDKMKVKMDDMIQELEKKLEEFRKYVHHDGQETEQKTEA
ncbi:MAG: YtxH domain-containing protein [Marinifilaceae bacterium]